VKEDAVSQVVGASLLVAVAVLAMAIILIVLFTGPMPTRVPAFSGLITNRSTTIYISHEGGDPLYVGQFRILVNGSDETAAFAKSLSSNNFSLGRQMNATFSYVPRRVVLLYNSSWGGGTVLLSTDLIGNVALTPAGWYDIGWLYRKKITIYHTQVSQVSGTTLANFPVLINHGDPDLISKTQASGGDLLFTASDGTTKLSHEIESFTQNSGNIVAWVKVPSLSPTTDTVIYMYYNNSGASPQWQNTSVWDDGGLNYYKGVWHLKENPAGTAPQMKDSTSNANDGTSAVTMTSSDQVSAKIDGGLDFDGSNDEIDDQNGASLQITPPLTIEAWVKPAVTGTTMGIASKMIYGGGSNRRGYGIGVSSGNYYRFSVASGGGATNIQSDSTYTDSNYHFIVGQRTATTDYLYVDGVQQSATNTAGITDSGNDFRIGRRYADYDGYWLQGRIDEVRISSTDRSPDWIKTEYNSQVNYPSTFYSLSLEQNPSTMN
jgi:hypothetical protein